MKYFPNCAFNLKSLGHEAEAFHWFEKIVWSWRTSDYRRYGYANLLNWTQIFALHSAKNVFACMH